MVQAVNIIVPTGGVIPPTVRLITRIRPKCSGSMPSLTTAGTSSGVSRISAAVPSISMPMASRPRLISKSSSSGSRVSDISHCAPWAGMRSQDM